jgi:hypothetical protein
MVVLDLLADPYQDLLVHFHQQELGLELVIRHMQLDQGQSN